MPILEMNNVQRAFGGLLAVQDVSITMEPGEIRGLIGPNGAGKTTIFNLVSGFYRPTQGDVRFDGRSIVGLRPHQVTALGLARTFQNIRMWNSMSVLENLSISQHNAIGYGLMDLMAANVRYREAEKRIRAHAMEILDVLGLVAYANEYPRNLPYGLQRRVEIGRALTIRPKLLLLDEPAAGMNPSDIDSLIELIGWIRTRFQLTIWLIEHQMRVVMSVCERLNVLDFGQIIAEGTPDEIRKNPRVIQAYLGQEGVTANA
ncbi:ABC transporter ATP-binding protein [Desulfatirhabdium butyrativorans]|uniref:ABC transporter ATP-binding protein n=1 Tax=Desulfatirhabdium butyrativorans TaxID=340467 RepID=UPI00041C9599|nr:ABC transporter ATP-binding protein [Desulfatirhabdium butyrativorans]